MERNKRQDEALQILEQVVEHLQAFWIFAFRHIREWAKFRSDKRDVLIANHDFQFLSSYFIRMRPVLIIFPASLPTYFIISESSTIRFSSSNTPSVTYTAIKPAYPPYESEYHSCSSSYSHISISRFVWTQIPRTHVRTSPYVPHYGHPDSLVAEVELPISLFHFYYNQTSWSLFLSPSRTSWYTALWWNPSRSIDFTPLFFATIFCLSSFFNYTSLWGVVFNPLMLSGDFSYPRENEV